MNEMKRCLLFSILLLSIPAAKAQDLSLDALLDDTGSPPVAPVSIPTALWPASVTIDQVYRTVSIDWTDQPDETLPFGAILQLEHARAWDGHPEELFVIFQDGRRVVIGRGTEVPAQVELIRAWLANSIVELPVGDGHGARPDGLEDPRLLVTAAGTELRLGNLSAAKTSTPTDNAHPKKSKCVDCIEKQDLDRVVRQRMGEIRGCYQRASQRDPTLAGEVVVRFEVSTSGAIGSATIKRSTLENSVVESCIREQFLKMVFPRPPGNKPIQASYPIVFAPTR